MSAFNAQEARKIGVPAWPWNVNPYIENYWEDAEEAWQTNVAVWYCVSGFGMPYFTVGGPDSTKLMERAFINNFSRAFDGMCKQAIGCRDDGKIIFDMLCLCHGDGVFEIPGSPTYLQYVMDKDAKERGVTYNVEIKPAPARGFVQISGPNAAKMLNELASGFDFESVRYTRFVNDVQVAGVSTRVVGLTMTGERGWELQCLEEDEQKLYAAIDEVGENYGMHRIGIKNHLVQHVEGGQLSIMYGDGTNAAYEDGDDYMAYSIEHQDLMLAMTGAPKIAGSYEPKSYADFFLSPIDIGVGKRIDWDNDFIGRDALRAEFENPTRKFVTLVWNNEDVIDVYASYFKETAPGETSDEPHYDYMYMPRDERIPIEASIVRNADGEDIAFTTSRSYLYSFRRMVSNCLIPLEYAEIGTEVAVVWGAPGHAQKLIRATVAQLPYKPFRARG